MYVLFVVLILIFVFSDDIVLLLFQSDFSSGLLERFSNIQNDGGSNRLGESDSEYVVALKQISENPFFGSYFRSLGKGFAYGHYPHNFILESLMTFGLLFSIPLMLMIYKAIVQALNSMKTTTFSIVALMLIFFILCYLTSGSMFLANEFWLPLALTIATIKNV